MKPSKQRKMLRAIQSDKSRRRNDKQEMFDRQTKVMNAYDPERKFRRYLRGQNIDGRIHSGYWW